MLNSQSTEEITAALRLVHEHKVGEFRPAVLARLGDDDIAVRREALSCLPAFEDERRGVPLWSALNGPSMAHVAVRALTSCGESIVPNIIAQLDSPDISSVVRHHLLRALGLIPSQSGNAVSARSSVLTATATRSWKRSIAQPSASRAEPAAMTADAIQSSRWVGLRWGLYMQSALA